MTHTDVSENSQLILNAFSTQKLTDSVASCISSSIQNGGKNNSKTIIQFLEEKSLQSLEAHYIEESTSGDKQDPLSRLKSQLRNGWQTGGGFRLSLNEPPKWDKYQTHSRNVRYKIHSWVMLDSLLVVDTISDDDEYLNLAVDIADDWIKKYVISADRDEFAWYDMAVGQRSTKLSYMLRRLIENKSSPEKIFRFILASEIHFSELMEEERIAIHSNHGLFQMAGLLSLCHNLPWMKRSVEGIDFSEEIFQKMLTEHFADDGLHLEHSPDYHLYMVNHLQSLNDSGWLSKNVSSTSKLINSIVKSANWMATPNNNVIPIGDTANNVSMLKRWAGYKGNIEIGCRFFPIGGLLINNSKINESLSQLVFSGQFHSRQHKHADNLNVLYEHKGQPLLVDPGTFTYQYDIPERMYCESTRGHNTVEIDDLNYSRFRQDAFGSAISLVAKAGDCLFAEGKVKYKRLISPSIPNNKIKSIDAIQVNVTHRRIIVERPGYFLAVIDLLKSAEEHKYTPWYHLNPNLSVKTDTSTKLGVYDENKDRVCQIQCYDSNSQSIKGVEVKGQTEPNLQGWYSFNGRELIENSALGFPIINESTSFVTVFDFKMEKTGKPYLRIGTSGKYLRFALTQGDQKIDFKMKVNENNKREIEVEIDKSIVDVEVEYDEG